jgi:hypothetical protein
LDGSQTIDDKLGKFNHVEKIGAAGALDDTIIVTYQFRFTAYAFKASSLVTDLRGKNEDRVREA